MDSDVELEFKTLDKISLHHQIDNFLALEFSEDGFMCIITNAGLYILHFRGYMNNFLKISSITKMFFKASDSAVADKLGIDISEFIDLLPQYDLYEAVLQADITPYLKCSEKQQAQSIAAKFSPTGLISNTQCALAVLNNYGSLEIFMRIVKVNLVEEFICIANISQSLIDNFKNTWIDVSNEEPLMRYKELKRRAEITIPTAFAWTHLISHENVNFSILIVGHQKGRLTFWRIDARMASYTPELSVEAPLLKVCETSLDKITSLYWVKAGNDGLLLIGDNSGGISTCCVTDITKTSLSLSKPIEIWNYQDNVKVDFFRVFQSEGKIYLFIIKRIHLLIFVLNEDGHLVDKIVFNADNLQITALEHYEDNSYFVLTYSGVLFQLKLTWEDKKIKIYKRYIHLKVNWTVKRAVGLYISPNKVFIGVLMHLFKLRNIKKNKELIKFLVMKNFSKDPMSVLMNEPTTSIKNYWDCFEILRLHGILDRKLPCHGLPETVDYDCFSLVKLKIYLWLAKSSEMMIDRIYFIKEYNIKSFHDIKAILQIKLAIKHMEDLFLLYKKENKFTTFQLISLYLHSIFLKEAILDNSFEMLGLGKNTTNSAIKVLRRSNRLKYPEVPTCFICGEKFINSKCSRPHSDNRCSISNVQILWPPYYKCSYCKCSVHKEIEKEYHSVLCPYCDIAMDYVNDKSDPQSDMAGTSEENRKVTSCNLDCDNSILDINDIEISNENSMVDVDFFNVSDVEESIEKVSAVVREENILPNEGSESEINVSHGNKSNISNQSDIDVKSENL